MKAVMNKKNMFAALCIFAMVIPFLQLEVSAAESIFETNDTAYYSDLLAQYKAVLQARTQADALPDEFSPVLAEKSDAEIGYLLTDLDENGYPELLIGPVSMPETSDPTTIYDLYTSDGDRTYHLKSSKLRGRMYLTNTGYIYYQYLQFGSSYEDLYTLAGTDLKEYKTLEYRTDDGSSHLTEYNVSADEPVQEGDDAYNLFCRECGELLRFSYQPFNGGISVMPSENAAFTIQDAAGTIGKSAKEIAAILPGGENQTAGIEDAIYSGAAVRCPLEGVEGEVAWTFAGNEARTFQWSTQTRDLSGFLSHLTEVLGAEPGMDEEDGHYWRCGNLLIIYEEHEIPASLWIGYEAESGISVAYLLSPPGIVSPDTLLIGKLPDQTASGEYVLPDSSSRILSKTDLTGLDNETLRIARNEIYARHGRRFKDSDLQSYFEGKSWYHGSVAPEDFDEGVLSETERANLQLIQEYEGE